jgi:hypothetical protein
VGFTPWPLPLPRSGHPWMKVLWKYNGKFRVVATK